MDRTNLSDDGFVSFAEVRDYVNAEASLLYDILVREYDSNYFLTIKNDYTLTAGTEAYALPTDFYKAIKLFYRQGGERRYALRRFNPEDDVDNTYAPVISTYCYPRYLYRIMGGNIYIYPNPTTGDNLELWYVPHYTKLVNEGDTITINVPVGWEDVICAGVGARCVIKEESDPMPLLNEKAELMRSIMKSAKARDAGEPPIIPHPKRIYARGYLGRWW